MARYKAMLFAPLPPPIGGITSITAMLHREFNGSPEVLFREPLPRREGARGLATRIANLAQLTRSTLDVRRGGKVILFASSRASFWEKAGWTAVIASLGRSPVIVMVAGDFPEAYADEPRWFQRATRWLLTRKNVVIGVQSSGWKSYYGSIFPGARTCPIKATVSPEFFEIRETHRSDSSTLTVLFVGWIILDKGVMDLLDAIPMIIAEYSQPVRFRLVGPLFGKDDFWRGEAARRGIDGVITFAGPVAGREAIRREYADADLFVFPSHYEGFPVALLEAIASGLPCIAADVGGVRDILEDGKAGVIVPRRAPRELAAAILSLLRDPALRAGLGAAAAVRARTTYTPAEFIGSYRSAMGLD
jgi:glycosyltransferase involved in cell wall biosynthesis